MSRQLGHLLKRPEAYSAGTVDGDLVMIDLHSGKFFALRGIALDIWHALDRTGDLDCICDELRLSHQVETDECRRDVEAFARQLIDAGFAHYS